MEEEVEGEWMREGTTIREGNETRELLYRKEREREGEN